MSTSASSPATPKKIPLGPLVFGLALIVAGLIFLGIVIWRATHPPERESVNPGEKRDYAAEAKQLLRQEKPTPLNEPLQKLLAETEKDHITSQQHPLLGKKAPDFERHDAYGNLWSLHEALSRGPVVLVFYYGYHCNHCVSQLFDVNEDYALFRELGAEVVALSGDDTELTRKRYQEYGAFSFPVLADPGNKVAQAYGVYTPAKDGQPEKLDHGTFIIDRDGVVRWAAYGDSPFSHNRTLLWELNRLRR
jgi:peroxiredoxin